MDMTTYLAEIEYASTDFIALIWREVDEVARLEPKLRLLTQTTEINYQQAESIAMMDDDDDGLAAMRYFETYFGPDKERHYKSKEVEAVYERIATHRFSVSSAAGSLLELAKGGLSLVCGSPKNWPSWVAVGSQAFGNVIRQSRNQAMHWNAPPLSREVKTCFEKMAEEINPVFKQYEQRSLAFEVVDELGWRTFDHFKANMKT